MSSNQIPDSFATNGTINLNDDGIFIVVRTVDKQWFVIRQMIVEASEER